MKSLNVPMFVSELQAKQADARAAAAAALGGIGREARDAIPALIVALKDEDASVRKSAAEALTKIRGDPKK